MSAVVVLDVVLDADLDAVVALDTVVSSVVVHDDVVSIVVLDAVLDAGVILVSNVVAIWCRKCFCRC